MPTNWDEVYREHEAEIAKAREDERQQCLKVIYDYMDRSPAGLAGLQACRELAALIIHRGVAAVSTSNGDRA